MEQISLSSEKGNVFYLIGFAKGRLQKTSGREEVAKFAKDLESCGEYSEILSLIERYLPDIEFVE